MQQEITSLLLGKQYLIIDSSKRESGKPEDFVIRFPSIINNIKSVKPVYTIMTNNVYNITAVNNTITYEINGIQ